MRRLITLSLWTIVLCAGLFNSGFLQAQRHMEEMDRGLVAVKTANGVFLSWRLHGYEWYGYTYNLYRDGSKVNDHPLQVSNYTDSEGTLTSSYQVEALFEGNAQPLSAGVTPWKQQYLEIPLKPRNTSIYEINDITTADLDGDGQYELIVKRIAKGWNENNTNYTYFEAYKLDGTFLWEINVGPNILPDVEINIAAFDFDEDGKAEVFMRTSEGTIFGDGTEIGDTNNDGITNYRYSVGTASNMQYMNEGPEFLSLIDGETGVELDRVDFIPRGKSSDWGDNYGHRASKYFFGAPYLDGVKPSLFIGRGIYTKTEMRTYDVVNKKLVLRWSFSSGNSGPYFGQGNHNFTIADLDGDGRDEIMWGSMAVNDDGTGLYSTNLGHGDAMHVGDLDPYRKGQEAWRCLENSPDWGTVYHDAGTGEILIHNRTTFDTGRAIAANISDNIKGKAMWGGGTMYGATNKNPIGTSGGAENFRIYWDGDLLEELLDHSGFTSSKGYGTGAIYKYGQSQPILLAHGATSCNYTKGTPSLQADLLGDWREEVVWRKEDNTAIRIYTTVDPTEYRIYTLMHDHQYRQAVAWQMCGYNQPPHVSFFLGEGEGKTTPPPPSISNGRLKYTGGAWSSGATNWKSGSDLVAFSDGAHVLFDATAGSDVSLSLDYEVAPQVLTVNSPEDIQLNATNGKLSGDMLLSKSGLGTFSLSGVHDYSGRTEVWGGRMELDGELTQSHVLLEFFGELALNGKIHNDLQMRYGSILYVGGKDSYGNTEISGDLTIEKDAELVFEVSTDESDELHLNGNFNVDDNFNITILSIGSVLDPGEYVLMNLSPDVVVPMEFVTVKGLTGIPCDIKQVGNQIILEVKAVREASTIYWNGADNESVWDLAVSESFKDGDSNSTYFVDQDVVIMDGSAPAKIVNINGEVTPKSVLVDTDQQYILKGSGNISGAASLTKSGSGSLWIENVNSFEGKVLINGGVLEVNKMPTFLGAGAVGLASTDVGRLVIDGGTLKVNGSGSADRAVTIGTNGGTMINSGELYWNQAIVGGNLEKTGAGKLILAGLNTHDKLTIRTGSVALLNEETNPGKTVVFEGGTLESYNNNYTYSTWKWNLVVPEAKSGTIYMDGRAYYTGSLTGGGILDVYIPFVRTDFRGNWSAFSGTINVGVSGSSGEFRIDNDFGYPNATIHLNDGVPAFHLSSRTVKFGALTGKGTLSGSHRWEIGAKNSSTTFDGVISGGNLYKTGSGVFTLTNANTYTGGTIVDKGRLSIVNISGSGTGSGAVSVQNGGSLNGTGAIAGKVVVYSGGRLFGGYTTVGESLTVNNDVEIKSGGNLLIRLNNIEEITDCLVVKGTFSAGGNLNVVGVGGSYKVGQQYKIIDAHKITGVFEGVLPVVPANGLYWDLSELYTTGILKISDQATSLQNLELGKQLTVFPNPVESTLYIHLPDEIYTNAKVWVQIVNAAGIVVKHESKSWEKILEIDLSTMNEGVYLLHVEANGFLYSNTILVK